MPAGVEEALADPTRRLGRYVVLEELGAGGMGVVHRGFDPQLEREVAIKVLTSVSDDRQRVRFEREAIAAARLRHPGIVGVHEVGEHLGRPFLVMDLVDGASLEERLTAGALPPRRVAELVEEAARALHHAHAEGIVHRDVKPENILVDARGRALVTDFGLVRDIGTPAEALTATGQVVGTPAFMAPEQAGHSRGEVTPATDVYGLGGVLYRALVGHPPFRDSDFVVLVRKLLFDEPPTPRSVNPEVHPDLETITLRCLEKDPERRYPSAEALADDLRRFCDGELIRARPVGGLERARRWARRHRLATGAAIAAGAAAIGGLVALTALLGEVERRVEEGQAAVVAQARAEAWAEAERTAAAFADARSVALPDGAGPEERRAAQDELLAVGLDAVAATATLRALALGDAEARRAAFEASMAYGQVALDAEQWSVAASSFERAVGLAGGSDEAGLARAAKARVETERRSAATARREAVAAILEDARRGRLDERPDGYQSALFALVREADAQTVGQIGDALDEVTDELRAVIRSMYNAAARPRAADAQAGDAEIVGLAVAVDRWLSLPPGEELDPAARAVIDRAARRLERWDRLDRPPGTPAPPARVARIIGAAQGRRLGRPRAILARLCCEALGRIGRREGALGPLVRYLGVERDGERSVAAGAALCLLGGSEARRAVVAAIDSFRRIGVFVDRITPLLASSFADAGELELQGETLDAYLDRGWTRRSEGDLPGALRDYDRAVALWPDASEAWRQRGLTRHDDGDLRAALSDLDRAVQLEPGISLSWATRAMVRAAGRDWDGAFADATRAIDLDPDDASAYELRGSIRRRQGDLDGAITDLTASIERDAGFAIAWRERASARAAAGDVEGALADAGGAIDADPGDAESWSFRGDLRADAEDFAGAIADLTHAVELEPSEATHWIERGRARLRSGDAGGAIVDLDQAIELDPQTPSAWARRAACKLELGDLAGAVADYDRVLELDPGRTMDRSNRAGVKGQLGDDAGAAKDLEVCLAEDPRNEVMYRLNLGVVLYRLGQARRAIDHLDRVIERAPDRGPAWNYRGICRAALGDFDGAIEDLVRSVELLPDDPFTWSNLGLIRRDAGDLEGALAALDRAIELEPNDAHGWFNRALIKGDLDDPEGAIADQTRAIELDPRISKAWAHRGMVRSQLDEYEKALEDCERAIAIDPEGAVDAFEIKGRILSELKRWKPALVAIEESLKRAPGRASSFEARGLIKVGLGDPEGAIADLSRYVELTDDESDPDVVAARAEIERLLSPPPPDPDE